jgi:hypothetical protein
MAHNMTIKPELLKLLHSSIVILAVTVQFFTTKKNTVQERVFICPKFEKTVLSVHSVLNKFWWTTNCARVERKEGQTYMCCFNEGGLSLCSLRIYRAILNPAAESIRGLSDHGTFIAELLLR